MELNARINKCIVYIIESLPNGDLKTGRDLYENLRQEWVFNDDYEAEYKEAESKEDVEQLLHSVADKVSAKDNHDFYVLHFETHGHNDGMFLSSGEVISWRELFPMIRPINIHMNDTLLVVLSMCDSKTIAYNIEPRERSPFRGVVVTEEDLKAEYLDSIWLDFYKDFTSTFFEGEKDKEPRYFSDYTPEHVVFFNQEFIFDIHSDLEEFHPEKFTELKDSFHQEFWNILRANPNEPFFMSPEIYLSWRVNKWRKDKQRLRDYYCFKDLADEATLLRGHEG